MQNGRTPRSSNFVDTLTEDEKKRMKTIRGTVTSLNDEDKMEKMKAKKFQNHLSVDDAVPGFVMDQCCKTILPKI